MKSIKYLLMACCVVMLTAGVSQSQTGTMALYSDEAGTDCNLYDTGAACPLFVHVIYKGPPATSATEFQLHQTGGAALIYLGETYPVFNSIGNGNPMSGIAVAYGCQDAPVHLLTVIFQGIGASATCSQLQILPDPRSPHKDGFNIAVVDCQYALFYAAPGYMTINPDEGCGCKVGPGGGTPTPVFETSWGRVKSLYVN
jgi:hypothetical protein